MHSLFLTNNPNLSSTSRILQSWLRLAPSKNLQGLVIGQRRGSFTDWLASEKIPHRVDPMPWPDRRKPWESLCQAARSGVWARQFKAEVIHCNEHDVYPYASLLKRIVRRPIVCHVRYRIEREFAEWAFRGRRQPDALLWTSYQQKADSATAVEGLVPEERQHVVRLGIDVQSIERGLTERYQVRKQWNVADHEILIGTASPLRPRKRVQDFIEIMKRLAAKHAHVVGIIAGGEIPGDEAYRQRIEREVAQSRLGRRLQWVGNLEPIGPFHHACDISVSTSEYETFGNSVCEAMAAGKPVVGYRGGSVREVVDEAGFVVPTGDLEALVERCDRLVRDSTLREAQGTKARQRVSEEFNPTRSFEQLLDIYDRLLCANGIIRTTQQQTAVSVPENPR